MLTIWSSDFTPRNLLKRNKNLFSHKNLYMTISEVLVIVAKKWNNSNVHQLMNKENMVCWYNEMLVWNKKEGSIDDQYKWTLKTLF